MPEELGCSEGVISYKAPHEAPTAAQNLRLLHTQSSSHSLTTLPQSGHACLTLLPCVALAHLFTAPCALRTGRTEYYTARAPLTQS